MQPSSSGNECAQCAIAGADSRSPGDTRPRNPKAGRAAPCLAGPWLLRDYLIYKGFCYRVCLPENRVGADTSAVRDFLYGRTTRAGFPRCSIFCKTWHMNDILSLLSVRDFSVRKLIAYEQDGADWNISAAVVRQISRDAVFSGNFQDCVHKGGHTKALLNGDCYEERSSSCCAMTNSTHIHLIRLKEFGRHR